MTSNIQWIEPSPLPDDGDTEKFLIIPNLYNEWREQPLVVMFHPVSHKRRKEIRRYGPLYRTLKANGWIELEQK